MQRIAHRGPDDSGVWTSSDRRVVLGHRRLSIIDLTPAGHQPMAESSGRLRLIFNGEIYNFQELRRELEGAGCEFRTHSDSEVILAAYRVWGQACVERFNGMFALAIHDEDAQRLFLSRDRIGKKPLFYLHEGTSFLFGSEAKAVLAGDGERAWELDPNGVNAYLTFGYLPGEQSIFARLKRLLPGHSMTYDLRSNQLTTWAYWSPEMALARRKPVADVEQLLGELETLLEDSVRLRLIADVPIGVLLSGGVDSSLITAMAARRTSHPVKTFTVTFPGGGAADESAHARIVADHFATEHHELPLPRADVDELRAVAHHLDEPLADPSILPTYLISRLTRQHVTVALGGDGGDELFGGYGWYKQGVATDARLRRIPRLLRRAAGVAAGFVPPGVRGRNFVRAHSNDLCQYMISTNTVFDPSLRSNLLRPVRNVIGKSHMLPEQSRRTRWISGDDGVLQMSVLDLYTYLPDDILVKVDRASMAFALEMRAPLLDYRIVEFALNSVPSSLKVSPTGARFLQRELARRLLPSTLELNRKQGFVMPVNQWLNGDWGDIALDSIMSTEARRWIDPSVAKSLLVGQRKGRTNGGRLFALLMFGLWLEGLRDPSPACGALA